MENKKITIADLALMIKNGFDGVDKRFDEVDKRFDKVEGDLNFLIDSSKRQFDDLCERLNLVEKQLKITDRKIDSVNAEIKFIRKVLETKLDEKEAMNIEMRVKKLENIAFAKIH